MAYWQEHNASVRHRLESAPDILWEMWRVGMSERDCLRFAEWLQNILYSLRELQHHGRVSASTAGSCLAACYSLVNLHSAIDHWAWQDILYDILNIADLRAAIQRQVLQPVHAPSRRSRHRAEVPVFQMDEA